MQLSIVKCFQLSSVKQCLEEYSKRVKQNTVRCTCTTAEVLNAEVEFGGKCKEELLQKQNLVEYEKMGCNVKWLNVEVEYGGICKEESVEARMAPFQAADCDLSLKLRQNFWLNANPEQRILKFYAKDFSSLQNNMASSSLIFSCSSVAILRLAISGVTNFEAKVPVQQNNMHHTFDYHPYDCFFQFSDQFKTFIFI